MGLILRELGIPDKSERVPDFRPLDPLAPPLPPAQQVNLDEVVLDKFPKLGPIVDHQENVKIVHAEVDRMLEAYPVVDNLARAEHLQAALQIQRGASTSQDVAERVELSILERQETLRDLESWLHNAQILEQETELGDAMVQSEELKLVGESAAVHNEVISDSVTRMHNEYLAVMHDLMVQLKEKEREIDGLKTELRSKTKDKTGRLKLAQEENEHLKRTLAELEGRLSIERNKRKELIAGEKTRMRENTHSLEADNKVLTEKVAALEEEIEGLKEEIGEVMAMKEGQIEEVREALAKQGMQASRARRALENKGADAKDNFLAELGRVKAAADSSRQKQKDTNAQLQKEVAELKKALSMAQNRMPSMSSLPRANESMLLGSDEGFNSSMLEESSASFRKMKEDAAESLDRKERTWQKRMAAREQEWMDKEAEKDEALRQAQLQLEVAQTQLTMSREEAKQLNEGAKNVGQLSSDALFVVDSLPKAHRVKVRNLFAETQRKTQALETNLSHLQQQYNALKELVDRPPMRLSPTVPRRPGQGSTKKTNPKAPRKDADDRDASSSSDAGDTHRSDVVIHEWVSPDVRSEARTARPSIHRLGPTPSGSTANARPEAEAASDSALSGSDCSDTSPNATGAGSAIIAGNHRLKVKVVPPKLTRTLTRASVSDSDVAGHLAARRAARAAARSTSDIAGGTKGAAKATPEELVDKAAGQSVAGLLKRLQSAYNSSAPTRRSQFEGVTEDAPLTEEELALIGASGEGSVEARLEHMRRSIQARAEFMEKESKRHTVDAVEAPTGTIVLMFTDVQDSTAQWEMFPEVMAQALTVHNDCIRGLLPRYGGYEVKTEGDAFIVTFQDQLQAVRCALEMQEQLLQCAWPEDLYSSPSSGIVAEGDRTLFRGFRVRAGLHTGAPICQSDPMSGRMDYFGPVVNTAARVGGQGKGGQVVISEPLCEALGGVEGFREKLGDGYEIRPLGAPRSLKGVAKPMQIYQINTVALSGRVFADADKDQKAAEPADEENARAEVYTMRQQNLVLAQKLAAARKQLLSNPYVFSADMKLRDNLAEAMQGLASMQGALRDTQQKLQEERVKAEDAHAAAEATEADAMRLAEELNRVNARIDVARPIVDGLTRVREKRPQAEFETMVDVLQEIVNKGVEGSLTSSYTPGSADAGAALSSTLTAMAALSRAVYSTVVSRRQANLRRAGVIQRLKAQRPLSEDPAVRAQHADPAAAAGLAIDARQDARHESDARLAVTTFPDSHLVEVAAPIRGALGLHGHTPHTPHRGAESQSPDPISRALPVATRPPVVAPGHGLPAPVPAGAAAGSPVGKGTHTGHGSPAAHRPTAGPSPPATQHPSSAPPAPRPRPETTHVAVSVPVLPDRKPAATELPPPHRRRKGTVWVPDLSDAELANTMSLVNRRTGRVRSGGGFLVGLGSLLGGGREVLPGLDPVSPGGSARRPVARLLEQTTSSVPPQGEFDATASRASFGTTAVEMPGAELDATAGTASLAGSSAATATSWPQSRSESAAPSASPPPAPKREEPKAAARAVPSPSAVAALSGQLASVGATVGPAPGQLLPKDVAASPAGVTVLASILVDASRRSPSPTTAADLAQDTRNRDATGQSPPRRQVVIEAPEPFTVATRPLERHTPKDESPRVPLRSALSSSQVASKGRRVSFAGDLPGAPPQSSRASPLGLLASLAEEPPPAQAALVEATHNNAAPVKHVALRKSWQLQSSARPGASPPK